MDKIITNIFKEPADAPNIDEEYSSNQDNVIGIDLGTRFSCVSIWRNKRFEIIPDQFGNRTVPSVVAFYRSAKLVGHNALAMKDVNPKNTIYDIKRIIGRRADDQAIPLVKKLISYDIIDDESNHHNIIVQLDKTDSTLTHKNIYRPEEICAYILLEIKRMASAYLGSAVSKAVITVPAYFNDSQRQATLDSAKIAGLDVLKIINEPTAAALAYGMGGKEWDKKTGGNIIVYDLGAGTLDVSLMNISNGVFKTLSVGGNTHLGGEDIDYLIMNHVMTDFQRKNKIRDLKISKLSQLKLKNSVENAKKILSKTEKAVVCVDDFYQSTKLYYVLTREIFETICNELFIMCLKPINDVLESANIKKDDIDEIILVGGSTRIPKIQKMILDLFRDSRIKNLTMSMNPDEVVSAGASIYGYIMTHHDDPFSENLVLLDITPLSLGVETLQKQMTTIIPRNTVIPTKKTKIFSTDTDNQDMVTIKIFEGERKLTKNNFHVGTFDLTGFEKGPRGFPTIKITFNVDINGILHVTAHEKKSDVQNSITITSTWGAKGRLSKNDIEKLITEAEKHEQIDTMYAMKIGIIHKIKSMCETISINLKNDAFALTNADKKKIKIDIRNNIKWINKTTELSSVDIDELQRREEHLSKTYAPLIVQINKSNDNFKELQKETTVAEVFGDDEDTENDTTKYQPIKIYHDPSEYDKQEIKDLKQTISELGKNIMCVVNNPVSNFTEEDITTVSDYISSVQIWLFTTSASTTIEFVAKINEINKFTEDIMKKYENQPVFDEKTNFSSKDELQLTCLTLNTSIKSNYFSLKQDDVEKLSKKINETMIWLLSHQTEKEDIYQNKINEISELCNSIYHSMHRMKNLEQLVVSTDETEETDDTDIDTESVNSINPPANNNIREKIDDILNKLPDNLLNRKINYVHKPKNLQVSNPESNKNSPSDKQKLGSGAAINDKKTSPVNDKKSNPVNDKKSSPVNDKKSNPVNDKKTNSKNDQVLLKIDINKLKSGSVLKYKNVEQYYR